MSYILVTNIYNEEKLVPNIIDTIAKQSLLPKQWVWIDDGSTDNGLDLAVQLAKEKNLKILPFRLPRKQKGNLDTIGRAWNRVHLYIRKNLSADFLAISDVDSSFSSSYFNDVVAYMNSNPRVGVVSGQIKGEESRSMKVPMNVGKVVRWDVIQSIEKYWDLAPDSYLNIKAMSLGYEAKVLDIFVDSRPSTIYSKKGRFRHGRLLYYARKSSILIFLESLRFALRRDNGSSFLRGYWQEWSKGSWKCNEDFIRYHYSFQRFLHSFVSRIISTLS